MAYDVSVLIPAYDASAFIARAIRSVQRQTGPKVQIVIAADDETDYRAVLAADDIDLADIAFCRTARRQSGPAIARNAALAAADAPILATLDADDEFADGRLAPLVEAARLHGLATGPTVELVAGRQARIGLAQENSDRLDLDELCGLRMPFAPVFQRKIARHGWPDFRHAEDLIFNIGLSVAAGGYPFIQDARYLYHRRKGSLSDSPQSLETAERGYLQILAYLETTDWPAEVNHYVGGIIRADLETVRQAQADTDAEMTLHDIWLARAPR